MSDNYCVYRSRKDNEIKRILNHNKVETNIVIEQIEKWNNSGDYDTYIELITDEKITEILNFIF